MTRGCAERTDNAMLDIRIKTLKEGRSFILAEAGAYTANCQLSGKLNEREITRLLRDVAVMTQAFQSMSS